MGLLPFDQFQKLAKNTRLKHPNIEVARLYFVEGAGSKAQCSEIAGVKKQAGTVAINRFQEEVDKARLIRTEYLIPEDKQKELDQFVKQLFS